MPGRWARRSVNRFGPEHQLADDEQGPPLAHHVERPRDAARVAVRTFACHAPSLTQL